MTPLTQEVRVTDIEEFVSNMKESIANIKRQIKTEVEQFMKVQACTSKPIVEQKYQ